MRYSCQISGIRYTIRIPRTTRVVNKLSLEYEKTNPMKTGTLAKRLKIDPKTVKTWTDEFKEFFSEDALKEIDGQTQRFYNPEDIVTLNTIRVMKGNKIRSEHIRQQLDDGYRERSMPPELSTIDGENAMLLYAEVAQLRTQIEERDDELERLRGQLGEKDERIIRAEREAERWKTRYEDLKESLDKSD
jgi:DNA-binding transcriptional MerR regulator